MLRLFIRAYWLLIPAGRRNVCLYEPSCSRHVFDVAGRDGTWAGWLALKHRRRSCCGGYSIVRRNGGYRLRTVTGEWLEEGDINPHVLPTAPENSISAMKP
jgi:putative component of membrane protein insertase Oxa1/YidC/SpoIIIJ protein YidD